MIRKGRSLLTDPIRDRGTAPFSARTGAGLRGLLPTGVDHLVKQVARVVQNCGAKPNELERYIFLLALQGQNETLGK